MNILRVRFSNSLLGVQKEIFMNRKLRNNLKNLMLRCVALPLALAGGAALADPSGAPWIPPYSSLDGQAQGTAWFVNFAPTDITEGMGLNQGQYLAVFEAVPGSLQPYSGIPNTPSAPTAPVAATFSLNRIGFTSYGPPPSGGYPFYGQGENLAGDVTNCNPGGPQCSPIQLTTLGGFLTSLGAVAGPVTYANGFSTASALLTNPGPTATAGLFVRIVGNMLLEQGQRITIAHDDGVDLILGTQGTSCVGVLTHCQDFTGTLTNNGAAFDLERVFWTGPAGSVPFDLVYATGRSFPEYLEVHVPEPGTLGLLGLGGMLLGLARRRRRN
jgi:PEP-CTERM motif